VNSDEKDVLSLSGVADVLLPDSSRDWRRFSREDRIEYTL
jgi:hypothetical protein